MCTVSFIPINKENFILTSNRDESPNRETISPEIYELNMVNLLFPKDKVAGGTWIGAGQNKRLICLLNGGFKPHKRKEKYRMSRGKIVTDLLSSTNINEKLTDYDLNDIEPFTLIVVNWIDELQLKEMVWDGHRKHLIDKPIEPTIWSSSLLYSEEVKKKREHWFLDYLKSADLYSDENIIDFHKYAGEGNVETRR